MATAGQSPRKGTSALLLEQGGDSRGCRCPERGLIDDQPSQQWPRVIGAPNQRRLYDERRGLAAGLRLDLKHEVCGTTTTKHQLGWRSVASELRSKSCYVTDCHEVGHSPGEGKGTCLDANVEERV